MIENSDVWPDSVRRGLISLSNKAQLILDMIEPYKIGQEAKSLFDIIGTVSVYCSDEISVDIGIKIYDSEGGVTDVKQLLPLFKWLSQKGYRKSKKPFMSGENGIIRYYYYPFEIGLYLPIGKEQEGACKYIQVGVKESPVYELVCK